MQSLARLTLVLCCAWVLTLLYGEMVAYWIPLWACSWPQPNAGFSSSSSSIDVRAVKVAVVADPQLMDRTSLSLAPKSLALEAAKFYTDLYMRRSFHLSILPFKPNLVIFLGDHFDGGPFLEDQEWLESYSRFKHIFGLEEYGRYSDILVYYLCGNHDIGYSSFHAQHPEVIDRYEKKFGVRNFQFSAGKVNFIVVDAQTLDGPKQDKETSMSWQFIKNISSADLSRTRVLLTHIPLYRPNDSPCGSYRYSSVINQRVSYVDHDQGIKYQNYLTKETSDLLLHLIKPSLVLSGHDHDQCTVTHSTQSGPVVEHTLGTVSWQQGNLYPSFMLLTAAPNATISSGAVSTSLCFLPKQTHIYIWYLCQFVVTILLLFIWPTNGFACFGQFASFISSVRSKWANMKEKTDEEDCEYDMIWDSEGSMHLIKKNKAVPVTSYSSVGVTGRGNAVLRSSAKKQSTQEQDPSVLLEMNNDMNMEKAGKAQRQNRSLLLRFVLRSIRVLRLITIIAAVNVPIYMMLLFKDWIDR